MNNLICIVCPRGCHLSVDDKMKVTGNYCQRGEKYAINELTHPVRMVTSTVRLEKSKLTRLPVMTSSPIPKEKIFDIMKEINKMTVKAPIKVREVIIKNVLNLDVDIIATREVEE